MSLKPKGRDRQVGERTIYVKGTEIRLIDPVRPSSRKRSAKASGGGEPTFFTGGTYDPAKYPGLERLKREWIASLGSEQK